MIKNDRLRYRSPITGKIKSSLFLEYYLAAMLLDLNELDCGKVVHSILLNELYGEDNPPEVGPKALAVYYAVTADLEVKGGEWLESCKRNKKNSDMKNNVP